MGLQPLPTTDIGEDKEKETPLFPYPKLDKGLQPNPNLETPVLSPFLKTQEEQTKDSSKASTEEQRMRELENMLSEAQSRAAVIEQEAYDKAYAAGEKSGLALGEKRAEQILETMQAISVQAEKEMQQLQQHSATAVADIAQVVIEHVMGEFSDHMQQILERSVNQALAQFLVGYTEGLTLAVNPQDLEMFTRMSDLPSDYKIRANQNVEQGTCRLISAGQDILIDPKQSIVESVQYVREHFLKDA